MTLYEAMLMRLGFTYFRQIPSMILGIDEQITSAASQPPARIARITSNRKILECRDRTSE